MTGLNFQKLKLSSSYIMANTFHSGLRVSQTFPSESGLNDSENFAVDRLFNGLLSSNRASLAQSITLIESTHARKRLQAQELLRRSLQHCKQSLNQSHDSPISFRIGKFYYHSLEK